MKKAKYILAAGVAAVLYATNAQTQAGGLYWNQFRNGWDLRDWRPNSGGGYYWNSFRNGYDYSPR